MKHEITKIFNLFEGDITSAAMYVHLITLLNANARMRISLSEVSKKTGFSRQKVRSILSRLQEIGVAKVFFLPGIGAEIELDHGLLVQFVTGAITFLTGPVQFLTGPVKNITGPVQNVTGLTSMSVSSIPKLIPLVNSSSISPTTKTTAKLETKTKSKTKSRRKMKPRSIPPEVKELAKEWYDWALTKGTTSRYNLEKFEDAILAMTKGTQKTFEDIRNMFEFIKSDEKDEGFCYAENFISPCTWKKEWANGLSKMDNAFKEMKRRKFQSENEKPKITQENISNFF
jgi:hypothetical protein